jgi:hypothetical protein
MELGGDWLLLEQIMLAVKQVYWRLMKQLVVIENLRATI